MEEVLRTPTSLFYFSGGVRHDAQRHGSQVYTLKKSELCNDTDDEDPYQSHIRGNGGFCPGEELTNEVRASRRESQCNQRCAQCPVEMRQTMNGCDGKFVGEAHQRVHFDRVLESAYAARVERL